MRIAILGGDGFCGWPTSLHLSDLGHDILIVDIGYPLRSRDVNMLGWRTRHPIPKAGSTTRAP